VAHPSAQTMQWLASPRHSDHPEVRVFGLPHAGAGAAVFFALARALPDAMELRPIRLPGRESRIAEKPWCSMAPMVEELVTQVGSILRTDQLPYVVFGSCSGAIIAYELARGLQNAGPRDPSLLVVAAQPAPHLPRLLPKPPVHALPGHRLRRRLLAANALPQQFAENEELWQLVEPAIRADFQASETYQHIPEPRLKAPILALRGSQDPMVSDADMAGWAGLSIGDFAMKRLTGTHDLLQAPTALADALAAEWRRVGEPASGASCRPEPGPAAPLSLRPSTRGVGAAKDTANPDHAMLSRGGAGSDVGPGGTGHDDNPETARAAGADR
jgi:medium-chain acyl-[acyl-carrier-protein] hydrolase